MFLQHRPICLSSACAFFLSCGAVFIFSDPSMSVWRIKKQQLRKRMAGELSLDSWAGFKLWSLAKQRHTSFCSLMCSYWDDKRGVKSPRLTKFLWIPKAHGKLAFFSASQHLILILLSDKIGLTLSISLLISAYIYDTVSIMFLKILPKRKYFLCQAVGRHTPCG